MHSKLVHSSRADPRQRLVACMHLCSSCSRSSTTAGHSSQHCCSRLLLPQRMRFQMISSKLLSQVCKPSCLSSRVHVEKTAG